MSEEIWLPVLNYEQHYEVSNMGIVRNKLNGNLLKLHPCTKAPYLEVTLSYVAKPRRYSVHRVVWMAFNGFIDRSVEINHINGIKSDNRLENLELSNRQHNLRHACENGLQFQKLTPDDVREIRRLLTTGITQQKIADMYGVNNSMICQIKTGKRWGWIE